MYNFNSDVEAFVQLLKRRRAVRGRWLEALQVDLPPISFVVLGFNASVAIRFVSFGGGGRVLMGMAIGGVEGVKRVSKGGGLMNWGGGRREVFRGTHSCSVGRGTIGHGADQGTCNLSVAIFPAFSFACCGLFLGATRPRPQLRGHPFHWPQLHPIASQAVAQYIPPRKLSSTGKLSREAGSVKLSVRV